jgi:hypothetical protein
MPKQAEGCLRCNALYPLVSPGWDVSVIAQTQATTVD